MVVDSVRISADRRKIGAKPNKTKMFFALFVLRDRRAEVCSESVFIFAISQKLYLNVLIVQVIRRASRRSFSTGGKLFRERIRSINTVFEENRNFLSAEVFHMFSHRF